MGKVLWWVTLNVINTTEHIKGNGFHSYHVSKYCKSTTEHMIRNPIYLANILNSTHHSGAEVLYEVEPLPLARSPDLHFAIPSLASLCTCVKIFSWILNFNLVQESTFGPVSSQSWTQVRASLVTTSSSSCSVMLEKMKPEEKRQGLCLRRSKLETKKHRVKREKPFSAQ